MSELAGRISELEQSEKRLEALEDRIFEEIEAVEQELGGFWEKACEYSSDIDDFMAERHLPALEEYVPLYVSLGERVDAARLAEWAALFRVRDGVDGELPADFPDTPVHGVMSGIPARPSADMDIEDRMEAYADRTRHCQVYVQDSDDLIEGFIGTARRAAEAGNAEVAVREFRKAKAVCAQIEEAYQEWWHALGESSNHGPSLLGPVLADHVRDTFDALDGHGS